MYIKVTPFLTLMPAMLRFSLAITNKRLFIKCYIHHYIKKYFSSQCPKIFAKHIMLFKAE
jgi:hypothetical protein